MCQLVEVLGVLAKGVHGLLLVLACHLAALAEVSDGGEECFLADAGIFQQLRDAVAAAKDAQQQVLHADELVVHLGGALAGGHEGLVGVAGKVHLTAADMRHRVKDFIHLLRQAGNVDLHLLEEVGRHVLVFREESLQQVGRLDGRVLSSKGNLLCLLHGLLRFDCELV